MESTFNNQVETNDNSFSKIFEKNFTFEKRRETLENIIFYQEKL